MRTVPLSSLKALYLATFEATKKWTMPIRLMLHYHHECARRKQDHTDH